MRETGGDDLGTHPLPRRETFNSSGRQLQTAHNPLIFFLAAVCGLCLAVAKTILRALIVNAWIIAVFLILSVVGGYFLNDYLEKNDSAYTTSALVQIPVKLPADPQHPSAPDDKNALALEMQSAVARFRDERLTDELLKDPDSPLLQTKWWTLTCGKDPERARDLLQTNLLVEPIPGSSLMRVSFTAPVKAETALILTEVVNQVMNAQREFLRDRNDAERRLAADLKNRYEIELRNAQADVLSRRSALAQVGASPFGGPGGASEIELASLVNQRIALQSVRLDLEGLEGADKVLHETREQGKIPPEVSHLVDQDPEIISARHMLDDLSLRSLGDDQGEGDSPDAGLQRFAILRDQWQHNLDELNAKKQAECLEIYASQIATSRKNVDSKLDHCNMEIDRLEGDIADIAQKSLALKNREEDMRIYRDGVKEYDQRLQYSDMLLRNKEIGAMDWFSRPQVPLTRTFPNAVSIMTMTILLGLTLSLCISFLIELLKWGRS